MSTSEIGTDAVERAALAARLDAYEAALRQIAAFKPAAAAPKLREAIRIAQDALKGGAA